MAEKKNSYKVLIIDANSVVSSSLTPLFEAEHFIVATVPSPSETLVVLRASKPDMIVLHSETPSIDGVALCREIRKESTVPIVIISDKTDEYDCLIALEIGADDFIRKPFGGREVVGRCKVILRRMNEWKREKSTSYIKIDNLEVDMNAYQITLNGMVVPCTPKEIEIVWMLACNPDIVFSREHLLQNIWGYDYMGDARAVDSHIKRIRAKLCKRGNNWDIHTVWGVGYRFEVDNQ